MKIRSAEFVQSGTGPGSFPGDARPELAFAGRSNVGKSTLMNRLLNRKTLVKVSKTPGKTRTVNFFLINGEFYFVDLPGYGFARVPEAVRLSWKKMVESFLTARKSLAGVILLVDIRRNPAPEDLIMKEWLQNLGIPFVMVATKSDKLKRGEKAKALSELKRAFGREEIIPSSSLSGEGREEIWSALYRLLARHSC